MIRFNGKLSYERFVEVMNGDWQIKVRETVDSCGPQLDTFGAPRTPENELRLYEGALTQWRDSTPPEMLTNEHWEYIVALQFLIEDSRQFIQWKNGYPNQWKNYHLPAADRYVYHTIPGEGIYDREH